MEKIPLSIVNLVAEDVPSIVLNGLDNKHQSFWEDTTYKDEIYSKLQIYVNFYHYFCWEVAKLDFFLLP